VVENGISRPFPGTDISRCSREVRDPAGGSVPSISMTMKRSRKGALLAELDTAERLARKKKARRDLGGGGCRRPGGRAHAHGSRRREDHRGGSRTREGEAWA